MGIDALAYKKKIGSNEFIIICNAANIIDQQH